MSNNIFVCQTLRHIYTVLILLNSGVIQDCNGNRVIVILCIDHQGLTEQEIDFSIFYTFGIDIILINEKECLDKFQTNSFLPANSFLSKNMRITWSGFSFASSWLYIYFNKIFALNKELDNVFLFHDRTFIGKCFIKFRNVTLIEDGYANYNRIMYNASFLKRFIRLLMFRDPRYYVLGESSSVKKIILFSSKSVPVSIRKKILVIDFKDLSSNIPENCVLKINALFRFDALNYFSDGSVFFLTQGLDTAGLCSTEEKIAIYETIIEFISRNKKIVVKLHPSETVEQYSKIVDRLENVEIANPKIPFELYTLNFKGRSTKIYSLYTSASIGSLISIINLVPTESDWLNFDSKSILDKAMQALRVNFNDFR